MPSTALPITSHDLASPAAYAVGEDAMNLHLRALLWCATHKVATVPLEALTRRHDAEALARALVTAGVWSRTAAGWRPVDDRKARLSEVRATAGRKGAAVTNGRQNRQTDRHAAPQPAVNDVDPRTVTRASDRIPNSEGSEKTENPTTSVGSTAANERVAVEPLALPDPEGERRLAHFAEAAGEAFADHRPKRLTADLTHRLAALDLDDATLWAMGILCRKPKAVWTWAKTLESGKPIGVAWLLGREVDGFRTGSTLAELVTAGRKALAAHRAAEARKKAEAEAIANRPKPPTPEELAATMARCREHAAFLRKMAA